MSTETSHADTTAVDVKPPVQTKTEVVYSDGKAGPIQRALVNAMDTNTVREAFMHQVERYGDGQVRQAVEALQSDEIRAKLLKLI